MHIYSVNDPEFKSYGNVWNNVPSELTSSVLEALSATLIPEGSKYVASAPELEDVKDADKLGFLMFGGRPFQLGWCNGHNTRLNCLEYHRASEFNLGARDFILLVAHRWEIEDGKLDTACVKAFRVPAGTVVEVFNTTLHYTPCMVDDGGFQVMVALPAGTNGPRPEAAADMPAAGDSYCYWKADKWVLCHADSPKAAEGGYVGLIGKKIDITVDERIAPIHHKGAGPLCGGLGRADIGKCQTGEAAGRLAVCGFWDMRPAFSTHLPVH